MPHLPAEIIDIIVGFATDVTVVQGYQDPRYMGLYLQRLRKILCTLSLVSRNWLPACRRELFKCHNVVFDVQESQKISDFLDVLRGRDQLPNLPHILSFIVTITLDIPIAWDRSIPRYPEEIFNLLDELAKRKEFFRPRTLGIYDNLVQLPAQSDICYRSDLISTIAKTFPTITQFHCLGTNVFDGCYTNFDHLVFFFKELQELDVRCWSISSSPDDDGSLHTYRFPEGLRALQYSDLFSLPNDALEPTLNWLRSHPPLRQMRRLLFTDAVPAGRTVIQGFINICPNLDALYLCYWDGWRMDESTSAIDLSHNKNLDRLCFYIPRFGDTNSASIRKEALLNTILLTVRTATSLRGSLEFLVDTRHFRERAISWWYSLGEAISALPHDVVIKVRMDHQTGHIFRQEKGEGIIRKGFRNLLKKHRRILFSSERREEWLYKPRGWDDFEEVAEQCTWKTIVIEDE
uniref:F-box domain-containing protein n=1 Tax=Moniliophthora roreri TaxID=221103 RepID=A0A0W0F400_MONRR